MAAGKPPPLYTRTATLLTALILFHFYENVSSIKFHILFVIMDDLGSHDLGIHGTGILTPTADSLARDGMYLSNYYVLPSCSPTRTSILSGRYPLHTGVNSWIARESTIGLPLDEETLPQILDRAGYRRHAVGKWHAGHAMWEQTPTYRGFESFYGFYMGSQDYFTHQPEGLGYDFRLDQGEFCGPRCSQIIDERGNYSSPLFAQEARRRIDNHDKSGGPLFLYLAFQAVHAPTEVPQDYIDKYADKDWPLARRVYAGMLTAADEALGVVINSLKENGLWNNTLVVYTTDNGGPTETCAVQGSSNYPKRGGKCTIWEGGTTGDGFLSGPALRKLGISSGTTMDKLFHCVDWLPTIASLVGATPSGKKLDGVNQIPALCGQRAARKELFVGRTDDAIGVHGPALRYKQWKIIEGDGGRPDGRPQPDGNNATTYLLFNLNRDPDEYHDVSQQHPATMKFLRQKLEDYKTTGVPQATNDPSCPWTGLVDTNVGPTWMPWCNNASRIVVYK